MSNLVTGEAVILGLRAAKLPSRALAIALDLLVEVVALFVTLITVGTLTPDLDSAAGAAISLGLVVFFLVALPILIETLSRGRSLGKLALGLRVVRSDGGPVRFRHSLVRGLVGFFEIIFFSGIPAVITSLVDSQGRRLGDIFSGSLVVRERVPGAGRGREALPALPPQLMQALGGELVALDLSAVPDGLWLAVRQYLARLDQLDPAVALGMAQRLVGDLVSRTGHAAPYGVHPAAYLGAVLAERQRREWARAAGAHGIAAQQPHPQGPYPAHQPYQSAQPYQPPQPEPQQHLPQAQTPAPAPAPPTQPTQQPQPPQTAGGFAPPA
ncbi:RDD family protein [Kitasatospora sp. NPDC056138]|uniref:RDD family protein n=1 Tax=Kitasatospora sp. NPDC056138 TaxID=3345724 RepID=UPI0035E264A4